MLARGLTRAGLIEPLELGMQKRDYLVNLNRRQRHAWHTLLRTPFANHRSDQIPVVIVAKNRGAEEAGTLGPAVAIRAVTECAGLCVLLLPPFGCVIRLC